tara:strand:- start:347 stop:634 length:288 start_codon:yes stop_codon:yes gene_type:complete
MSKKLLQFLVLFLAILIIICFIAIIYGMYLKITKNQKNYEPLKVEYNLNLNNNEKIQDIDVLNDKNLLFTISNNDELYVLIYDIELKEIVTKIKK